MEELTDLGYRFKEFTNTLEEFGAFVSEAGMGIFIGVAAAILVFIVEVKWMNARKRKRTKKDEAIELGHIVNGQRIKFYDDTMPGESSVGKHYHATYSYEVGGKGYQYRYFGAKFPPEQLEMYYINNPRRLFSDLDMKREPFALVFFFLPIIVMVIVTNLVNLIL
ncbi:MAG: hypothetical protein J6C63_07490 [Lachnospiraceae bacterium]|nr:hypothetical protein [Lachnospiraceae bacterium]